MLRKTFRDSQVAVLTIALALGVLVFATAWAIADGFPTLAERRQLALQMEILPAIFQGLLGQPFQIETLPGFVSWRLVNFLPVMLGLWSIVVLSGTIAGEAARGTLELVLSAPISRRSLAFQKYAAHVLAIALTVALVVVSAWLSSGAVGTLPTDTISLDAGASEFLLVALIAMFSGSLAFALGPLLGRGVAAGVAATYLFGAYLVNGYAGLVPGFDLARVASIFYWTQGHRPMQGVTDWSVVVVVAGATLAMAGLGVALFERRDLASTIALGPRAAAARRGLRVPGSGLTSVGRWSLAGPFGRSVAERLPAAVAWGGAMALYGLFIASAADAFAATIEAVPQMADMIRLFYPEFDFTTVGGVLQLAIFTFLVLVVGLAAAVLVSGWTADERDGRLEVVLAAPIRRARWVLLSGAGVLLAMIVLGAFIGVGPAIGAVAQGDPFVSLLGGGLVLGLYGAALIGVGFVVAGLGQPGRAGIVVAGLTLAFYLLDLIGGILRLPDDVLNLSMNRHLGRPMSGTYDVPGLIFSAAVALGGLLVAAWAYSRRDLQTR